MKLFGISIILFTGIMFAQSSVEKFTPQLNTVVKQCQSERRITGLGFLY